MTGNISKSMDNCHSEWSLRSEESQLAENHNTRDPSLWLRMTKFKEALSNLIIHEQSNKKIKRAKPKC